MSKPIAVQGCTLEIVEEGKSALSIQISTSPSSNVKFDGKGAYSGQLSITLSGYTGGDIVSESGTGEGSLSGTAQHVKIDGKSAVLEDDKSLSISLVGVNSRGRPAYDSCTVKIASAGQDYVKGE
jgi:hypothetical protein